MSEVTKKVEWPSRELQMYKYHEPYTSEAPFLQANWAEARVRRDTL